MKVLISGFEPFGNDKLNASMELLQHLPDQIGDLTLIKVKLPVTLDECEKIMVHFVDEYKPDFVINLGQAKGRSCITLERIAINVDDFSIPDNAGKQLMGERIKEDGADGYFSNLAIKAIVKAMRDEGFKAAISNTAGTYLCNHIMYCMQYLHHTSYPNMKTGFVHVPCLPQQVCNQSIASMEFDEMLQSIKCLLAHLCDEEIKKEEGAIC